MFGLPKERPTLGDHPKAHIHEIQQISCEKHDIAFPQDSMKLKNFS